MLLLDKFKTKKGVSAMIGYVLLIGIAVGISGFVFITLKSYVPVEEGTCADGVSLFVSDIDCVEGINYDDGIPRLNVTIKNNGRFDAGGYHIHATTKEGQKTATKDLSENYLESESEGGYQLPGSQTILFFKGPQNSLSPAESQTHVFKDFGQIYSIEITPIRFEEVNNRKQAVSCGNSKVVEMINCESSQS